MHLALARGDRSRRRSGPSRVASGRGRGGTRRAGRLGARALGRPGAGARRPRRGGCVPAARGRADAPTRPDGRDRAARRRRGEPAGGHVRRRASAAGGRGGRARWTSCSAPAWTCCAPRRRIPRAAAARLPHCSCEPRRRSSRSIRSSRARPISTRGARRCSPGGCASTGSLHHVSREALARPRPAGPRVRPICCWTGSRWRSPRGAPQRRRSSSGRRAGFAGEEVSVEEVLRWGWLATAAAVMVWDYETCVAVATRGVLLAREAGALAVLAVSVNVLAQAVALGGEFGSAASLIAEADSVTEATGTQVAPYGALVLAGLQGREAEAADADRCHHRRGDGRRPGDRCPVRALGALRAPQRSRPLRGGAGGGQEASDDTPELFVSVWALSELIEAAARSERRRREHAALSSVSRRRPRAAATDWGARASRPVRVRC